MVKCTDSSLYTGVSNDVDARVIQHNSGKGAKYTRSRLPVALVYSELATNKSEALRREIQIKKLSPQQKRKLVIRARRNSQEHSKAIAPSDIPAHDE